MVFFSMTRTKDSSEVDIWTRVGNFQSTFFLLVKEKKKKRGKTAFRKFMS